MELFDNNIAFLIERHEFLTEWLSSNISAPTYLFEEKARERNILSVRIHNYYRINKV